MGRDDPFRYCLNTSTIRGQGLDLPAELKVAAEAGYDGIEPWVRELDAHAEAGGSVDEIGAMALDLGLAVENLIGFFAWAVDDEEQRRAGFEEARRNMEMAERVGCPCLAAPPFGATEAPELDLRRVAERYRELIELGDGFGVTPVLEFWGVSRTLGRLSEALYVAAECGDPGACILGDVFHMYKGGSPYEGLRLLGPWALAVFHMNDFPAVPPREAITDADRVYPGDGVAPMGQILGDLHAVGFAGPLSLELFNEDYWRRDALEVVRTGLAKMRAAVHAALEA